MSTMTYWKEIINFKKIHGIQFLSISFLRSQFTERPMKNRKFWTIWPLHPVCWSQKHGGASSQSWKFRFLFGAADYMQWKHENK